MIADASLPEIVTAVGQGGALVLAVYGLYMFVNGRIHSDKEIDQLRADCEETKKDRDFYRNIVFKQFDVGDQVVKATNIMAERMTELVKNGRNSGHPKKE